MGANSCLIILQLPAGEDVHGSGEFGCDQNGRSNSVLRQVHRSFDIQLANCRPLSALNTDGLEVKLYARPSDDSDTPEAEKDSDVIEEKETFISCHSPD